MNSEISEADDNNVDNHGGRKARRRRKAADESSELGVITENINEGEGKTGDIEMVDQPAIDTPSKEDKKDITKHKVLDLGPLRQLDPVRTDPVKAFQNRLNYEIKLVSFKCFYKNKISCLDISVWIDLR